MTAELRSTALKSEGDEARRIEVEDFYKNCDACFPSTQGRQKKGGKRLTSHIRHSFSFEDSTGRFVCWSVCPAAWRGSFAQPLSPHSCECDAPKCSLASAALPWNKRFSNKCDNLIYFFCKTHNYSKFPYFWIFSCEFCSGWLLHEASAYSTSAVHVAGCYRVHVASLEVK